MFEIIVNIELGKGVKLFMKKKILIILLPFVIIIGGIFGSFYYINSKIYSPLNQGTAISTSGSQGNDDKSGFKEETGMTNILLVGLDGRSKDSDSRTDSIIMASIDSNNKKVKLTSFMRDMYVPIPNHGDEKINSAFFFGGPQLLIETLNQDFSTNIQYYVSIDFRAFQALVDKLGGIDVDIKDYEVKEINKYIKEANWKDPDYIDGAGYQHLNGQQALSYCRIRKVGNNDYERTERQRKVLGLLIDKARGTSVFKLPELFSTVLPYIKTNIPASKLMNLGYTVYKFGSAPTENLRIPADGTFSDEKVNGQAVLVPDFERNVALLEEFLSSSGSSSIGNVPVYMANNFHEKDKPVDKRGIKRKTVEVHIDRSNNDNQNSEKNGKDTTPVSNSSTGKKGSKSGNDKTNINKNNNQNNNESNNGKNNSNGSNNSNGGDDVIIPDEGGNNTTPSNGGNSTETQNPDDTGNTNNTETTNNKQ